MFNIKKTLESLQPYVIGIRYQKGLELVDVVFKDNWLIPESNKINKFKGDGDVNYYMFYSENENIGLDEILQYVDDTIKLNIDRENKHELLKQKINDLKEVFKQNSLNKLKKLKFTFLDDDLIPELESLDKPFISELDESTVSSESTYPVEANNVLEQPLNPNSDSILTDEDKEFLEEERRAENYRKIKEVNKLKENRVTIKN